MSSLSADLEGAWNSTSLGPILACALVLMLMPALGAALYSLVQWVLHLRRKRQGDEESGSTIKQSAPSFSSEDIVLQDQRFTTEDEDNHSDTDVVTIVVEYLSHISAFVLLSWSVWLVTEESLTDLIDWELNTAIGYSRLISGTSLLLWTAIVGTLLGIAVVAFIRSSWFVHSVDVLVSSVVRHFRPPFADTSRHHPHHCLDGTTPDVPPTRRMSSSVVLSIVMFVHAGMEGIVLGLMYHRPVFTSTFWSVALHNVPEGLVMAVPVFSELRKAARPTAATGRAPTVNRKGHEGLLWQGLKKSTFAALWSHAGQAFTFLWIAAASSSIHQEDGGHGDEASSSGPPTVLETLTAFVSIGSIIGTIVLEILPDVLDVPRCLRSYEENNLVAL
ncbi:membrane-associated protein, putative [Bodo saltans]|uniref:Membrane-associated protein, putative n=1 Tax=Bodo saltans TaxID=75058 RepID=A0A0S4KK80_BODSA|nr:membrane-associated protein, putative [Bodo saltans]|eukprot:CUI11720.1 membrane-associated protein, putative [Bodo saltans]